MRQLSQLWTYRSLLWQFVKREVLARYRGSWLGLSWTFLTPLLLLAVYTFVFTAVFKARWHNGDGSGFDFALRMYAGLVVFNLFAEVVGRAPRLVVDQPNLIKKVVFPVELLAWVSVLAALVQLVINTAVLLLAALFSGHGAATMLLLPLVWLPLLPLLLGLSWLLSALGVYVRDVSQIIGLALSLLMFLSPIFYPVEAMPPRWQPILQLNPLTLLIENTRLVLLDASLPALAPWLLHLFASLLVAALGRLWFMRLRKGFADVL